MSFSTTYKDRTIGKSLHVFQTKQGATQKCIPEMIRGNVRHFEELGPVYTTVEKASGRSRMLGQDMVI
jgi:hypothetical protein